MHLSDKAIENIKVVKSIKNFNEDRYYGQNSKDSFEDNTFSLFIENFTTLNEYIEKFKEFINLIELQKNIDYLKTICGISLLIDNYIENKEAEKINNLIDIYNKVFEIIQLLSYSNICTFYINGDIKKYYNEIINNIKKYNKERLLENIDLLKNELYQIILFLEKDKRRCEYELNFILSKFYEHLLNDISKNYLSNSSNYVNKYIINVIKENQKLMKQNTNKK